MTSALKRTVNIVLVSAEEAGVDFGLGLGVVEVREMIVPADDLWASVVSLRMENELLQKLIRFDYIHDEIGDFAEDNTHGDR